MAKRKSFFNWSSPKKIKTNKKRRQAKLLGRKCREDCPEHQGYERRVQGIRRVVSWEETRYYMRGIKNNTLQSGLRSQKH
jgi:hypothetical protein